MQLDFVSILAAILLVFPSLAAVVLFWTGRKLKREVNRLEGVKANLSDLLAVEKERYNASVAWMADQTIAHQCKVQELISDYEQQLRAKDTELYDRRQSPLHDLHDDEFVNAVREELLHRVKATRHAQVTANQWFGGIAHKLATQLGGVCFRVVDHCKRGHKDFAQFGPYPDSEKA